MLHDSIFGRGVHGTHHCTNGANKTDTEYNPWVRGHQPNREPRLEERSGSKGSETESNARVLET